MKTKIVYVAASHDDDVYIEQVIVSAWSARHYNPESHIVLVCCQDTFATLEHGHRKECKALFSEIIVKNFEPTQNMMERSRWMKTTLRDIVDGDFLFLDTDTVVCEDLSYVDDFDFDLGFVLDCNTSFDRCLFPNFVLSSMKKIYDMDVTNEKLYFNSGVSFVRDSQLAREFYHRWNENWVHSLHKCLMMKDQQPLMKTNIDMGYVITELSGNLNCQVAASIKYLHSAHIVHFFNNLTGKSNDLSPFYEEVFLQLKENGLTSHIKEQILNCKSSFVSPSMPVPYEGAVLWRSYTQKDSVLRNLLNSNSYHILNGIYRNLPKTFAVMEWVSGNLRKLTKKQK